MLELEWYENVRNGFIPLCDRCIDVKGEATNINIENFQFNRYGDKVYCDGCWNWIHLMKFRCDICKSSGSMRSKVRPFKLCCGREVTWLE